MPNLIIGNLYLQDVHAEEAETTECEHCGDDAEETERLPGIGEVCIPCRDDNYILAADGDLYLQEDTFTCESCDDVCHSSAANSAHRSRFTEVLVCDDCVERYYIVPTDTDSLWHRDYVNVCDCGEPYLEEPRCEHEYDEEREDSDGLYGYAANVLDVCGWHAIVNGERESIHDNKALALGVELETDERRDSSCSDIVEAIRGATDFDSYAICKSDATCSGPEIVTLPADLASHKSTIPWAAWCEAITEKAKGYYGNDNGMHVHMNLKAISPLTLGKMLVFLNDTKSTDFLCLIAQRHIAATMWAKAKPHTFAKVGKAGKMRSDGDKYSILNVSGRGTAELRMFKSTLLPERIFKNLEFCDALVNWCRAESAKGLTVAAFKRYIARNRKSYMHLHTFIENRSEA